MEGRFWGCQWTRTNSKYRVWVKTRPRIAAEGKTWQHALDAICAAICEASGDGEPNLSFDPPEPAEGGDARFVLSSWLELGASGWLPVDTSRPELYTGGLCPGCRRPVGERTDVPVIAREPGEGELCWPALIHPYLPLMFSERLVEALSAEERAPFRWMPVTPAPRTRKRYIECIPKSLIAPVAVRGWTISESFCDACGYREVICCTSEPEISFQRPQIHQWVAPTDLPSDGVGMLAFGDRHSWLPLLPASRARDLAERFRGIRLNRIGLAPWGP